MIRISASQLKSFAPAHGGCPRKWALTRLAGVPKVETDALRDGTRIHELCEGALTLTDAEFAERFAGDRLAPLAAAMVRHLPRHAGARHIEETWFWRPSGALADGCPDDVEFYIKPDLYTDDGWLCDWKSTSAWSPTSPWVLQSPAQWDGPPPDEVLVTFRGESRMEPIQLLQDDVQANLYAIGIMDRLGRDEVQARWVYGSKRLKPGVPPTTWIVEHLFQRATVERYLVANVWPVARAMADIRRGWDEKQFDSPLVIPHNESACGGVGQWCDGLAYCHFDPSPIKLAQLGLPAKKAKPR